MTSCLKMLLTKTKTAHKKYEARRSLIYNAAGATLASGGLAAALVHKAWEDGDAEKVQGEDQQQDTHHLPEASSQGSTERSLVERDKRLVRTFETGPLAGKPVHNLAAEYLGFHRHTFDAHGALVPEVLPEKYVARPDLNMERIWDRKELLNHDMRITGLGNKLIQSYREELLQHKEEPMNLLEFMQSAEDVMRTVAQEQDREKIAILYQLDSESSRILAELGARIESKMLVAFSMTEIMASGINAETDAMTYDAVLRNNGARFVTRIPAVYDRQASFGPYQATLFAMKIGLALGRDGKVYKDYQGASKMNRALPEGSRVKIPEEVQNELYLHKFVQPEHHHSFAYQFALHNLANALSSPHLHAPQLRAQLAHISDETLTAFIATSHHKPTPSAAALTKHLQHERKDDFRAFCPPDLQTYATRTLVNKETLAQIR